MNLIPGSIVSVLLPRLGVTHKGILFAQWGTLYVIQNSKHAGHVICSTLVDFCESQPYRIEWQPGDWNVQRTVIARATSQIGRTGFSLLFSNCEDFVNWCTRGVAYSETRNLVLACVFVAAISVVGIASLRKAA